MKEIFFSSACGKQLSRYVFVLVGEFHLSVNSSQRTGGHYEVEYYGEHVLAANISGNIAVHDVSDWVGFRQPYSFEVSFSD